MSKALRHTMVGELEVKFKDQKNVLLIGTEGLTGTESVELRAMLHESEGSMRMVKNSVALHTFRKLGVDTFDKNFSGMTAVVYGPDPLALAKSLVSYKEKTKRPVVRAAIIEGKPMEPSSIVELAKLPGRDELLAQLLSAFNAVTQKFVATLNEIPRSFVATLQAVSDKDNKS